MDGDRGERWDYTVSYENKLENQRALEEREYRGVKEKYYQGRRMIARDTPINGGVYVCMDSQGQVEAVVVDDKTQKELDEVYKRLLSRSQSNMAAARKGFKRVILKDVFELVQEELPYDLERSTTLASEDMRIGRKIALEVFVGHKAGVCRHQALLAAYLLERLKKERRINPKSVSVDRNYKEGLGHCWVRYTNSVGDVFIIDPAMRFFGKLDDENKPWGYERPEDLARRVRIKV